jgi:hypothetical protein
MYTDFIVLSVCLKKERRKERKKETSKQTNKQTNKGHGTDFENAFTALKCLAFI